LKQPFLTKKRFKMKKTLSILICFFSALSLTNAQTFPTTNLNYQAAIRDNAGKLLENKNVALRFAIMKDTLPPNDAIQYQEIHNTKTNEFGLVNVIIGKGDPVLSTFSALNWKQGYRYIRVELDPNGGTLFKRMGWVQLQSVAYANVANEVINLPDNSATNEIQSLSLSGNVLSLSLGGGSVTLPSGGGGGSFTLPYNQTINSSSEAFKIKNNGSGYPIAGEAAGNGSVAGVYGLISTNSPAIPSAGVVGFSSSTSGAASGVWGEASAGNGVYGKSTSGNGVEGSINIGAIGATNAGVVGRAANQGYGVAGFANSGIAGYFSSASGPALVTGTGRVGIGTNTPTASLEVAGQVKITGGAPGAGKVLTSDASGLATWQTSTSGTTYSAGAGINISGSTISNSGDLSNTNEIQTLSLAGNTLSLSNGGGAVTLPSASGLTLPYDGTTSSSSNAIFRIQNSNATGSAAIMGIHGTGAGVSFNSAVFGGSSGTYGVVGATLSGSSYASVLGYSYGLARGVWGKSQNGIGGYFETIDGNAALVSNGRLGINTESPVVDLHINAQGTNTESGIAFSNPTTGTSIFSAARIRMNGANFVFANNSTGYLSLGTAGNDHRIVLENNGNVGIGQGVLSNTEKLTIKEGRLSFSGNTTLSNAAGIVERSGFATLSFGGSVRSNLDNTDPLGSSDKRWITVFATNGTINTSDRREKTNIKALNYGLKEVMSLKPVTYEWKERREQGTKIGFIAQDLQQTLPEVVSDKEWVRGEDGKTKSQDAARLGVYYSDIIPVLTKAIQEQQAMIEALQKEVAELKKKQ
jgi:hypothetical protein